MIPRALNRVKSPSDIIQLRQVLAERFPHARAWTEETAARTRAHWPTGLPELDTLLHGGHTVVA